MIKSYYSDDKHENGDQHGRVGADRKNSDYNMIDDCFLELILC